LLRTGVVSAESSRVGATAVRSARPLVIGAALVVAIAIAPVAVGLASALVLYELLAGPYARLARHVPRPLAALVTVCAALLVIVGPMAWLGFHVATRVPAVVATVTTYRNERALAPTPGIVGQLEVKAADAVTAVGSWLPALFHSVARNAAFAFVNWTIALFGLYYLLGGASTLWPRFARLLPLSPPGIETLRTRFHDIAQGMVAGTLLSAAIQGVAIGTGFWLAGLPDALFWGAAAAIATLVPVVGNAIVSVPALLLMVMRQNYTGAIAIAVFSGPFPPIIDRVVRSTVSRRVGRVHPMVTLVGALVGAAIAGVAGLILGPVALAMFFVLLEVYEREQRGSQPVSAELS
jgi:predicted PurR-regulated permease PerM